MFKKKNYDPETKEIDFVGEMKTRCTPQKLASVAGIAVIGYVVEVALKLLTGTQVD